MVMQGPRLPEVWPSSTAASKVTLGVHLPLVDGEIERRTAQGRVKWHALLLYIPHDSGHRAK